LVNGVRGKLGAGIHIERSEQAQYVQPGARDFAIASLDEFLPHA